jgi:hypothetical protein
MGIRKSFVSLTGLSHRLVKYCILQLFAHVMTLHQFWWRRSIWYFPSCRVHCALKSWWNHTSLGTFENVSTGLSTQPNLQLQFSVSILTKLASVSSCSVYICLTRFLLGSVFHQISWVYARSDRIISLFLMLPIICSSYLLRELCFFCLGDVTSDSTGSSRLD